MPAATGLRLHVHAQRQQIGITVQQDGLEAALKQMPHHAMTPVERLRVNAIGMSHQPRQVGLAGMHHPVVVLAHLAIGQHLSIKPVCRQRGDL